MNSTSLTRTTCPYCGVGCGVIARVAADETVTIEGDPDHPANFGKLCAKGLTLGETLVADGRLRYPHINGKRASWADAVSHVAEKFMTAIREHGPDSVAFYVSGQLLTEDYYVANKLMKGFIGSANIDTNSRLCMASAVAGHKRAFGADVVPCSYTDLEDADLVVLVGSNLSWCHPVLFQRLEAAREKRGVKLVVIDPRRTATAQGADLFLQIAPGSDVALFDGLLRHLYLTGETDQRFIFSHTHGLSNALIAARQWTPAQVAATTGVAVAEIEAFFAMFARHAKTVTAFSMGVNQAVDGTNKVNAIINVHLVTGRIGKAGAGPFSITGQPNAMGGREVGGLATMLAAHRDIGNTEHRADVKAFWQSPRMAEKAGLKAVDLFNAVHEGKIKALWIMGTNPAVSMPDAAHVAAALQRCDFVAVSDVVQDTETTAFADVLLPAMAWGEKDGTVTNTERRISRQRRFSSVVGEARADWRIICDVASAMGFEGFHYAHAGEIFAEHVALTRYKNNGARRLDLSHSGGEAYDLMPPRQWGGERPFSDGLFQTDDGRARFVPTVFAPSHAMAETLTLNTGRMRDQWHTMTRTGLVPKLFSHRAEPYIEISPGDAKRQGLEIASIAEVVGVGGTSLARVLVSNDVADGAVFQPMHWSKPFAAQSLTNVAVRADRGPFSGQPALKSARVMIRPYKAAWYGCGVSLDAAKPTAGYWAAVPLAHGLSFECADQTTPDDWLAFLAHHFALDELVLATVASSTLNSFRCAGYKDGRLAFAFFASNTPVAVNRRWLQQQLGSSSEPHLILAGRPPADVPDQGPIVCACNGVGRHVVEAAASSGVSLTMVCEKTTAGMGCGSCRPEIMRIIAETGLTRIAAE